MASATTAIVGSCDPGRNNLHIFHIAWATYVAINLLLNAVNCSLIPGMHVPNMLLAGVIFWASVRTHLFYQLIWLSGWLASCTYVLPNLSAYAAANTERKQQEVSGPCGVMYHPKSDLEKGQKNVLTLKNYIFRPLAEDFSFSSRGQDPSYRRCLRPLLRPYISSPFIRQCKNQFVSSTLHRWTKATTRYTWP